MSPSGDLNTGQIDLAWAHYGSEGGYKKPSPSGFIGARHILHDGGVAAGKNLDSELGIPGTVEKNVMPDSANSLKALLDRDLRERVVHANEARVHPIVMAHSWHVHPGRASGMRSGKL
jgi:hypothetical protein